jgi:hypothetical protein
MTISPNKELSEDDEEENKMKERMDYSHRDLNNYQLNTKTHMESIRNS